MVNDEGVENEKFLEGVGVSFAGQCIVGGTQLINTGPVKIVTAGSPRRWFPA